jgi:hypothetical protein
MSYIYRCYCQTAKDERESALMMKYSLLVRFLRKRGIKFSKLIDYHLYYRYYCLNYQFVERPRHGVLRRNLPFAEFDSEQSN